MSGVSTGFTDPQYTQLVDQVQTETDPPRQKQLWAQVTDYLLDQSFAIPIATNIGTNALFSSKVNGVRYSKHAGLDYSGTWIQ